MSAQSKEENNHYTSSDQLNIMDKKVNLNDLIARMNESKKQEKKIIFCFQQQQSQPLQFLA